MELELFGGPAVRMEGREVRLWPRGRHLLGLLALCAGTAVPSDVLIFHMWPERLPADPEGSLHELICRLRKSLRDTDRNLVGRSTGGYRLNIGPEFLDIAVFRSLAVAGMALGDAEPQLAKTLLTRALERSRGRLPDIARDDFVAPRLDELEDLRNSADNVLSRLSLPAPAGAAPASQNRRVGLVLLVAELPELVTANLVGTVARNAGSVEQLSDGALSASFAGVAQALRAAREALDLLAPAGWLTGGAVRHLVADRDHDDRGPLLEMAEKAPRGSIITTAAIHRVAGVAGNPLPMSAAAGGVWQLGGARLPVPGAASGVESPFTGRSENLSELAGLLLEAPLVTLRGPGGIGKSRLATVLAANLGDRFDEVKRVDLAEADRFGGPITFIANRLGSITQPDRPIMDTLLDRLSDRKMLLLLDNAEVFIDEVRRFCNAVNAQCPGLRLLATSRCAVAADGELIYDLEGLPREDATTLLLALAVPGSLQEATDIRDSVVRRLCDRLDGIPLAIECTAPLAATMGGLEKLEATLDSLPDGAMLPLLDAAQAGRGRHRSIELALTLSHRTLSPDEARFFERLSCLRSTFTAEDASVAASPDAPVNLTDALSRLGEVSLLRTEGQNRWRMLEPIRQFAATLLLRRGDSEPQAERHGRYFVEFAERSASQLRSPDEGEWFERLTAAYPNLAAALTWAIRTGRAQDALRLSSSLHWYWAALGMNIEGASTLERALNLPGGDFKSRAKALCALAHLSWWAGDPMRCETANWEALALVLDRDGDEADLTVLEAWARSGIAASRLWGGGNRIELEEHLEVAEKLFTQVGDQAGLGIALGTHGALAWHYGDDRAHLEKSRASLDAFENAGHQTMIGHMKRDYGLALAKVGRHDEGRRCIQDGLRMADRLGDTGGLPLGYAFLGLLELCAGRPAEAADAFSKSLVLNRKPAQKWAGLIAVAFAADKAAGTRPAECLSLSAFVDKQTAETGVGLSPTQSSHFRNSRERARALLSTEDRIAAATEGENMTLAQCMPVAIDLLA